MFEGDTVISIKQSDFESPRKTSRKIIISGGHPPLTGGIITTSSPSLNEKESSRYSSPTAKDNFVRLANDGYSVSRFFLNEAIVVSEPMSHDFSFDFKISLAMP